MTQDLNPTGAVGDATQAKRREGRGGARARRAGVRRTAPRGRSLRPRAAARGAVGGAGRDSAKSSLRAARSSSSPAERKRSGGGGPCAATVEGASAKRLTLPADAPSTALRAVPLPRFAGQDERAARRADGANGDSLITTNAADYERSYNIASLSFEWSAIVDRSQAEWKIAVGLNTLSRPGESLCRRKLDISRRIDVPSAVQQTFRRWRCTWAGARIGLCGMCAYRSRRPGSVHSI